MFNPWHFKVCFAEICFGPFLKTFSVYSQVIYSQKHTSKYLKNICESILVKIHMSISPHHIILADMAFIAYRVIRSAGLLIS